MITEVRRALNVIGGISQPGVAPPTHGALRQALEGPCGPQLLRVLSQALEPVAKRISIGDLGQRAFAADGSFRRFADRASRMTGWRFPPEETSLYYKTDELLEVLSKIPEFVELSKAGTC